MVTKLRRRKIPIFDFYCETCKQTNEQLVKQDIDKVECPNCGAIATKQVSAPGAFILKGTGFYKPSA